MRKPHLEQTALVVDGAGAHQRGPTQEFGWHLCKLWSDALAGPLCLLPHALHPLLSLLSEITSITLARHQKEIMKQEECVTVT